MQTSLARVVAEVVPLVTAWALDRTFDYEVPLKLTTKVRPGVIVRCRLGRRRVRAVVVDVAEVIPERDLLPLDGLVLDAEVAPPRLGALLEWVAVRYAATRGSTYKLAVPPRVRVKTSAAPHKRLVATTGALASLHNGGALARDVASKSSSTWAVRLGSDLRRAIAADIVAAADESRAGTTLIVVPEIAGPSLIREIAADLPAAVTIDSGTDPSERSSGLIRLARGEARIGIGGRAGVFAAVPKLAAIVVIDEDHIAYKEERSPRYDVRRAAMQRARHEAATCILMSATPLLETAKAVRDGAMGLVEQARNVRRENRPVVELVPMPPGHPLSPAVLNRIRRELDERRPAAVVANDRGFARVLWCASCRRSLRCPECDSAMAFDKLQLRVRCPRCAHSEVAPDVCPTCGAADFTYLGAGAERLEGQLAHVFPRARVARLDPDLAAAGIPDADVYVTTWYGTKEAIRPHASVVAVLDTDALIRRPDFRAAEMAHRAFARMAEWVGPASEGGRLLLQTNDPGHHAIQAVTRGDYWFFAERELQIRSELAYPPFTELIRLNATGSASEPIIARAAAAAQEHGARILGPVLTRGTPQTSLELLIKCEDALPVAEELRDILASVPAGTRLRVDVDPR